MVLPDQIQLTGGSALFIAQFTPANHLPPQELVCTLQRRFPKSRQLSQPRWDLDPQILPIVQVTGALPSHFGGARAPVEAVQSSQHNLLTGTMAVPWPHAGTAYLLLHSSSWSRPLQDNQLGVLFSSASQAYMY